MTIFWGLGGGGHGFFVSFPFSSSLSKGGFDFSVLIPFKRQKKMENFIFISRCNSMRPEGTRKIHPCLRLVPSGNLFLILNRSHHFCLKKSEFNKATWAQQVQSDLSCATSYKKIYQLYKAYG